MTGAEWSAIRLSFLFATLAATIGIGYWLARSRRSAKWIVEVIMSLPLVLPPIVTGYILLYLLSPQGPIGHFMMQMFGIKLVFTPVAAVIAATVVSFPLLVRTVRLAFQSVDPELESAARTLGTSRFSTFVRISLPLASRGLIAGWVLAFARSLGEFGATIMVAGNIVGKTQTIPLAIFSMSGTPGGIDRSWRLVALAVLVSCAALVAEQMLERYRKT